MRIEAQTSVGKAAASKLGSARRAGGFSALVGSDAAAQAQTSAPVGLIGSVVVLGGSDDAAGRRSRGLAEANALLDELEGIRRSLLLGDVSQSHLGALSGKLEMLPDDIEPGLATILDEIRLRVAVELAKLSPAHLAACRSVTRPV